MWMFGKFRHIARPYAIKTCECQILMLTDFLPRAWIVCTADIMWKIVMHVNKRKGWGYGRCACVTPLPPKDRISLSDWTDPRFSAVYSADWHPPNEIFLAPPLNKRNLYEFTTGTHFNFWVLGIDFSVIGTVDFLFYIFVFIFLVPAWRPCSFTYVEFFVGEEYIKTLLDDFLFAASKAAQLSQTIANSVLLQSGVRFVGHSNSSSIGHFYTSHFVQFITHLI